MKTGRLLTQAMAATMLLLCWSQAKAADLLVIESRGAGLRPGTHIDSTKPLTLREGQHLTLSDSSGMTFTLDGPYDKAPGTARDQVSDLLSKGKGLFTQRDASVNVGTIRGNQTEALPLPEPWLFDVSQTANVCILEGSTAVLWRPIAAAEATFTIMPTDHSWSAQMNWPAGVDRITAGRELPIRTGGSYLMVLGGNQAVLTVNTVPSSLVTDSDRAAWMAGKGCEAQAKALVNPQR